MKSYHFDFGNSTSGPIGFCARVNATSEARAARKLQLLLARHLGDLGEVSVMETAEEYIEVYINPDAVGVDSIDEINEEDTA